MPADLSTRSFSQVAMRNARVFAGLTQQEVAEKLNTSRQWIVGVESGLRRPNDATIQALALALGVPHGFLLHAPMVRFGDQDLFLRSVPKVPERDIERAKVGIGLFTDLSWELSRWLRFPNMELPRINATSEAMIGEAARRCREALGLPPDQPIQNLTQALECAGIFVVDASAETDCVDAFSVRGPPRIIVRSTAKGSTSRRRYDLAHECGHLVLHQAARPEGDEREFLERQANSFAGQFLYPLACLKREFPRFDSRFWHQLFKLKLKWGLSIQAIIVQASHAGLLTGEQQTRIWQLISRRGWRRREPEEPLPETPQLLEIGFRQLYESKRICPTDVIERLDWNVELFERVVGISVAARVLEIGAGQVIRLQVLPGNESMGPRVKSLRRGDGK